MPRARKSESKPPDRTGECITDEELERACCRYFVEHVGWTNIYRELGHSPATWVQVKETDRFREIRKRYQTRLEDLRELAWAQLEKRLLAGDPKAISEVLDRTEGTPKQRMELSAEVTIEHNACDELRSRIAGLVARVRAGAVPGDADGGTG